MTDPPAPLALVEDILEWLRPFFADAGYAVVTTAMFLESAAFTGVVVPGDVILAVGGAYAARGALTLPVVIACGIGATIAGETVGFVLGRRYGDRLLHAIPLIRRFGDRLERAQRAIERRGGLALVMGRFATGVAGLVPFVAGTAGVSWGTFVRFAYPTAILWAIAVASLGYVVGSNVAQIDRVLSWVGWGGLAGIVLALGAWWLVQRKRRERAGTKR